MRRYFIIVLLMIAAGVPSWSPAVAQDEDDPAATISALETRVAELESLLTPTPASQTETESGTDASPGLFGPGLELFPSGELGEISVVLVGAYTTWLPVIIQNNLDETVSQVKVSAAAYSSTGELIGAGISLDFLPNLVEPGDYAIGNVSFSSLELPPDVQLEFKIEYDSGDRETILQDLTVISAVHQGDRIVGEVKNSSDVFIENNANVTLACLDSAGNLLRVEYLFTADGSIDPEETAIFQIDDYYFPCDVFVVTSSGYGPI